MNLLLLFMVTHSNQCETVTCGTEDFVLHLTAMCVIYDILP